jgi:hypothetical protein
MSKSDWNQKEHNLILVGAKQVRRLHKEQAKGVRGNKRDALRDEIANNYAAENDFSEEQKEKLFEELRYPFEKRMRAFNQMKKDFGR